MNDEDRKKIEEIMGEMSCPKNFTCAESGFEILCKARDTNMTTQVECLDANARICTFALSFGDGHICKCPLRVYLSKKLKL